MWFREVVARAQQTGTVNHAGRDNLQRRMLMMITLMRGEESN